MNINSFIPPKWRKPSLLLNFFIDYIHRNFTFNSKDNKLFIRPCVVFVPPAELNYKSCFHIFKFNPSEALPTTDGLPSVAVECLIWSFVLSIIICIKVKHLCYLSPPNGKPFNVSGNTATSLCKKFVPYFQTLPNQYFY